jgi:hypothetical protein
MRRPAALPVLTGMGELAGIDDFEVVAYLVVLPETARLH